MQGRTSLPFPVLCFPVLESCEPESVAPVSSGRLVRPHARFSSGEDEKLRRLVEALGTSNWGPISQQMGTKNPRQCRERWCNYLDPQLNTADWNSEEDALLLRKYFELGAKWVKIARFFPNKTDAMVKNRFNKIQRDAPWVISQRTSIVQRLLVL
jgi:hypothetical protein